MNRTDEQIAVIDAFGTGETLVVQAMAGAGKTSTTRMCAESQPTKRGVYVAFNKAIATDAQASFPRSCVAFTVHSLAFRAVGHEYAHRLNGPRVTGRQTAEALRFSKWLRLGIVNFSPSKTVRIAMDTVTRFCHSDDLAITRKHVPWIEGLSDHRDELAEIVVPIARRAWEDLSSKNGVLRYSHDCYLKIWSLSDPYIPCDYLIFDEAQDSSPVIAHVVECQEQAQKLVIGDRNQQIYEWRGSVDAMDAFGGQSLPLSQSFRFGPAIADEANRWLELLDCPTPIRGSEWVESTVGNVEHPRAILCRTNAQVVAEAMDQQAKGVQPAIVGGVEPIIAFANAAEQLKAGKGTWHHDLQGFKDWDQVVAYTKQDHGGRDLQALVNVIDKYGTKMVVAIMQNCLPETTAPVVISTGHKAKGREWESVKLADDFHVQPHEDKKTGEMKDPPDSELRLAYVACTRAKLQLDASGLYSEVKI